MEEEFSEKDAVEQELSEKDIVELELSEEVTVERFMSWNTVIFVAKLSRPDGLCGAIFCLRNLLLSWVSPSKNYGCANFDIIQRVSYITENIYCKSPIQMYAITV